MNPRLSALLLSLAACGRTQGGATDGGVPTPVAASAGADASAADAAASSAPAASAQEPPDASDDGPYLRGATWITCKEHFRAESTPERDLIRLGLLCGPNHGMRRQGEMVLGSLKQDSPHRFAFEVKREHCYRLMAAWEAPLQSVAVRVADAAGAAVAQAESEVRWVLVDPQGALCADKAGSWQVELTAVRGEGSFAAQVWMLK